MAVTAMKNFKELCYTNPMRKFIFILMFLLTLHVARYTLHASPVLAASPAPCPSGKLCNPLGTDKLEDLVTSITNGLKTIAIPIAVLMIIFAGVKFLIAGGNTEMVTSARKTLTWAIVGLAIILIGTGFLSLIQDILTVKKGP